jgi:hypothetical protein
MKALIHEIFNGCVYVLQVLGGEPGEYGFGYELANLIVFVILEPALILLFAWLWWRERLHTKRNERT